MKMNRTTITLTTLIILAGCATAAQRRQNYVNDHPDLSPGIAEAVIEGRVKEGMTTDDVRAAWGEPARETLAVTEAGDQETWSYSTPVGQFNDGTVILIFTNHKLVKLIN
jgi:outer membrane protein assembly factor BamE (lipoprotein component of BamABCDE complex)